MLQTRHRSGHRQAAAKNWGFPDDRSIDMSSFRDFSEFNRRLPFAFPLGATSDSRIVRSPRLPTRTGPKPVSKSSLCTTIALGGSQFDLAIDKIVNDRTQGMRLDLDGGERYRQPELSPARATGI